MLRKSRSFAGREGFEKAQVDDPYTLALSPALAGFFLEEKVSPDSGNDGGRVRHHIEGIVTYGPHPAISSALCPGDGDIPISFLLSPAVKFGDRNIARSRDTSPPATCPFWLANFAA